MKEKTARSSKFHFNAAAYSAAAMLAILLMAGQAGAQIFTTLHNFAGESSGDGAYPYADLILSDNTLYGTTYKGGTNDNGTVFGLNTNGTGFTVLHTFTASADFFGLDGPGIESYTNSDGANPEAGLILSGNTLYGAASDCGTNSSGTVFALNTNGKSFTVLSSFTVPELDLNTGNSINSGGAFPESALILSGNTLYGTTYNGGTNGSGTVFAIKTDGTGFTVMHTFTADVEDSTTGAYTNGDGDGPDANLILSGNTLYGTADYGGTNGNGTVFAINTNGTGFTVLHTFTAVAGEDYTNGDGADPDAGLILSGNTLYGTADYGGTNGNGTVFAINTNGTDFTVLHTFTASANDTSIEAYTNSDGANPNAGLILSGSILYGAASDCGTNGSGTVFALNTNGTDFTILHSFTEEMGDSTIEADTNSDGANPDADLILSGNTLYGTANVGGTNGNGTVFSLTLLQVQKDVQTPFYALIGGTVSNSVTVEGPNLAYQWQFNGVNLNDNADITGSQSNVLTLSDVQAGQAGNYQVVITNIYDAVTSSVATLTVVGSSPLGFNGSGLGWTTNQSGDYATSAISNNLLTLTDGGSDESRSFFFDYPQYVGAFKAAFTYQDVGGGSADGVVFVLQNDPRGPSALGTDGGDLGVGGTDAITNSAELELNVYTDNSEEKGYTFLTNGLTGAGGDNGNYHPPGAINLASGDPINITVNYTREQMALTFTDVVAGASFTTNLDVGNLTNIVAGQTAYVGFTGADGGATSTQIITNFWFASVPTTVIGMTGTNVMISWPSLIAGYTLQKNSSLVTANWLSVTNPQTVVNGQNQVTVPLTKTNEFYRLILQ